MSPRWGFTLLLTLVLAGPAAAEESYPPLPESRTFGSAASEADAAAVDALMDRFTQAWREQDVEALLATYADDAEWMNAFGWISRGHPELRETFTELFERFGPPVTARSEASEPVQEETTRDARRILSRRYVGADGVVIHGVTESDWGESRDGSGLRRVHITYVLQKRAEGWRIVYQSIMDVRR